MVHAQNKLSIIQLALEQYRCYLKMVSTFTKSVATAVSDSETERAHFPKQGKQIKELTPHYNKSLANSNIKNADDIKCMEDEKKSTSGSPQLRKTKCECGLCCPNCLNPSNTTRMKKEYGKSTQEFTPGPGTDRKCTSVIKGANQSSNKRGMASAVSDNAIVSIINMPSQVQGQKFGKQSGHRDHSRSIVRRKVTSYRPATAPSSVCQEWKADGWKREVRSATIYTRYKTPELFSLIYSDLKSNLSSSLSITSPRHIKMNARFYRYIHNSNKTDNTFS